MKKILAIALAALMIAAMAVPAFAAGEVFTEGTDADGSDVLPQRGSVKVTYGVAQSYIVTIPQDVAFDEATVDEDKNLYSENTLTVSNVKIRGNEKLTVAITSKYGYNLVDENQVSANVTYWIATSYDAAAQAFGNTASDKLENNEVALVVNRPVGNDGTDDATGGVADLTFMTKGTSQQGSYFDMLTFTVDIEEDDALKAQNTITRID